MTHLIGPLAYRPCKADTVDEWHAIEASAIRRLSVVDGRCVIHTVDGETLMTIDDIVTIGSKWESMIMKARNLA